MVVVGGWVPQQLQHLNLQVLSHTAHLRLGQSWRQVHCHTNKRRIYENYRWEAGSLSHKYKTNIWKLQVGGRFTVTQIQDEYMKITGGRQVHCHTNTRRIYENYRWEAGSLSHKYKTNIWKLQVGGRFTVTQIQEEYMILQVGGRFTVTQIKDEYMKITGGRQVHCHTNTRGIYDITGGRQVHCHTNTRRIYKFTGWRQVHCHTNTRRIYEKYRWEAGSLSYKYKMNIWYYRWEAGSLLHKYKTNIWYYRWEAGSLSHKYKTNIWKLQVGGRLTVTQIQDEYMKITGGRQVHCHTNTRRIL